MDSKEDKHFTKAVNHSRRLYLCLTGTLRELKVSRKVEENTRLIKKTIGLLILFVHSKHCKSSRGPEVVVCVSVCVWLCGCFFVVVVVISSREGEQAPFLLSVGYAPVTWTALQRRPVDLNIAPTWHLLLSKGREKYIKKILPSAHACRMTSDKLFEYLDGVHFIKVNQRLRSFCEAYPTLFFLASAFQDDWNKIHPSTQLPLGLTV